MTFRPFNFLALAIALTLATGCGHQQKIQDLLKAGAAAQDNEDYAEAIRDYSQVIKLDPKSAEAYLQRGDSYYDVREFKKAISDLDQAIRLEPANTYAHKIRGNAYFGISQMDKAISDYDTVLKADPKNAGVWTMRGRAFYWQDDYTNSIADLTRALKFDTNSVRIFDYRANTFYEETNWDLSLKDYNAALRLDPEDAKGLYGRGLLYYRTGHFPEAAQDFATVIGLKPKTVLAYNKLAWLLATCPDATARDGKKAVPLATKACSLSKWEIYAYVDTLAAAYAEAGDFDSAVKYQQQAAGMNDLPDDNRTNVLNRLAMYRQHQPYRTSGKDYDY